MNVSSKALAILAPEADVRLLAARTVRTADLTHRAAPLLGPSLAAAAHRPMASWIRAIRAFRRTATTREVLGIAALRKDLGAETAVGHIDNLLGVHVKATPGGCGGNAFGGVHGTDLAAPPQLPSTILVVAVGAGVLGKGHESPTAAKDPRTNDPESNRSLKLTLQLSLRAECHEFAP